MKYFNALCIFLIIAFAASYVATAELEESESSLAAKSHEKRGIYGLGYGHGIGYGGHSIGYGGHSGGYGGHSVGYGGLGFGHAYPAYGGYAAVHAAPIIAHGHGFYPHQGHGFYH